ITVVDLENPVLQFSPSFLPGYAATDGAKKTVHCGRVQIGGVSRLKFQSYANSLRVTLTPSVVIPERLHNKVQVCFHRNASSGMCQCGKDDWKAIQYGQWNALMSPYQDRYVDLMFMDGVSVLVEVSVEEEVHRWRLFCLAFGFVLLMLAPFLSEWVPFYCSSSMAVGVLLVVLILLFQAMKLLPTGRKSAFYVAIYGSVIGVGSFVIHYFSMLVNSILVSFGLSEDMYNLVSIFLLVGVILAGAALGYWIMRKFVISDDGRVDVGVAQFVKWAMRVIAVTFIFQSTLDAPFAMVALAFCWGIYFSIMSPRWRSAKTGNQLANRSLWLKNAKKVSSSHNRPEFLSRTPPKRLYGNSPWSSLKQSFAWADSPTKGLVKSSFNNNEDFGERFYSSFHKTPACRRFSKREWEEFTSESTRRAVAELASSPEFSDWIVENADRIKMDPDYSSDDDSIGSGEHTSDETVVDSGSRLGFLKW
ncbi:hypothetical protein MKX01_012383, partial [Papaver californicum]